jgi:hypothetical protein
MIICVILIIQKIIYFILGKKFKKSLKKGFGLYIRNYLKENPDIVINDDIKPKLILEYLRNIDTLYPRLRVKMNSDNDFCDFIIEMLLKELKIPKIKKDLNQSTIIIKQILETFGYKLTLSGIGYVQAFLISSKYQPIEIASTIALETMAQDLNSNINDFNLNMNMVIHAGLIIKILGELNVSKEFDRDIQYFTNLVNPSEKQEEFISNILNNIQNGSVNAKISDKMQTCIKEYRIKEYRMSKGLDGYV